MALAMALALAMAMAMAIANGGGERSGLSRRRPLGGQIMKTSNVAQLLAAAQKKRALRTKDWLERAKLVVAAARDRAVETAQQRRAPSMKRFPTVLQRRRLAERLAQYGTQF
jgi:hypothetical protein